MVVSPLPIEPAAQFIGAVEATYPSRSVGVHVSDLIREAMVAIDPKNDYIDFDPDLLEGYRQFGFWWEDLVGRAMGRQMGREYAWTSVGELHYEGVYLTPDWMRLDGEGVRVVDTKATWKSCRDLDAKGTWLLSPKWCSWLMQLKAYCLATGTLHAELYILFVIGDYTRGPVPQRQRWIIDFTERELAENWQMLRNFGKRKGLL